MAEVYWDLEWTLQQQGFDYTYDKRLYDRLEHGQARPAREHLLAGLDFQDRMARFLENHDEPRAAATFAPDVHRAAAIITFLSPGLRFFHQGQFEGRKIRIPVHLRRGPAEPVDHAVSGFYSALLECLRDPVFREGDWRLLECRPAWDGNWTSDCFIAYSWTGKDGAKSARSPSTTRITKASVTSHFPGPIWRDTPGDLQDRMGTSAYERDGSDLASQGLYLDMPAWSYHVFQLET